MEIPALSKIINWLKGKKKEKLPVNTPNNKITDCGCLYELNPKTNRWHRVHMCYFHETYRKAKGGKDAK